MIEVISQKWYGTPMIEKLLCEVRSGSIFMSHKQFYVGMPKVTESRFSFLRKCYGVDSDGTVHSFGIRMSVKVIDVFCGYSWNTIGSNFFDHFTITNPVKLEEVKKGRLVCTHSIGGLSIGITKSKNRVLMIGSLPGGKIRSGGKVLKVSEYEPSRYDRYDNGVFEIKTLWSSVGYLLKPKDEVASYEMFRNSRGSYLGPQRP